MSLYADVILPLPLDATYTYRIPDTMSLRVGERVIVPLRGKKFYTAIVDRIHDEEPVEFEVKDIEEQVDREPVLLPQQQRLWHWMADYYLCALLLDRKLDKFASEVTGYYPLNDSLPQHYKEALVLYKRIRTNPVCVYNDESLEENFNDYQAMLREKAPLAAIRNKTRRAFGRTYWYYYNNR